MSWSRRKTASRNARAADLMFRFGRYSCLEKPIVLLKLSKALAEVCMRHSSFPHPGITDGTTLLALPLLKLIDPTSREERKQKRAFLQSGMLVHISACLILVSSRSLTAESTVRLR
jgi:hypothetical protein